MKRRSPNWWRVEQWIAVCEATLDGRPFSRIKLNEPKQLSLI